MKIISNEINMKKFGILIVDDELAFRLKIENYLKGEGFLNIFVAVNGAEALGMLIAHGEEIYAVILDLRMPKIGGLDVIKHLVNHHTTPVGIIVSSVIPREDAKNMVGVDFFEMGNETIMAMEYLNKPFEIDVLLDDVKKTISAVHSKRQAIRQEANNHIHSKIDQLKDKIDNIAQRQPGFVAQLGLDVLRTILVAISLILLLLFGFGDFVRVVIEKIGK